MKPNNLYRSDADREVWDRAEQDAKAAGVSLASHVVGVLRIQQEYDDRRTGEAERGGTDGSVTAS